MTAGGGEFLEGFFDGFTGFACALLNPTKQFVTFAVDILQIVIREFAPFLFQLALDDVPIAFGSKCVHVIKLRLGRPLCDGVKPYLELTASRKKGCECAMKRCC